MQAATPGELLSASKRPARMREEMEIRRAAASDSSGVVAAAQSIGRSAGWLAGWLAAS